MVIMIGQALQARLADGVEWALPLLALRLEGEADHHDGVLLDDADEQDDADQGDDRELGIGQQERDEGADAGGRSVDRMVIGCTRLS